MVNRQTSGNPRRNRREDQTREHHQWFIINGNLRDVHYDSLNPDWFQILRLSKVCPADPYAVGRVKASKISLIFRLHDGDCPRRRRRYSHGQRPQWAVNSTTQLAIGTNGQEGAPFCCPRLRVCIYAFVFVSMTVHVCVRAWRCFSLSSVYVCADVFLSVFVDRRAPSTIPFWPNSLQFCWCM